MIYRFLENNININAKAINPNAKRYIPVVGKYDPEKFNLEIPVNCFKNYICHKVIVTQKHTHTKFDHLNQYINKDKCQLFLAAGGK